MRCFHWMRISTVPGSNTPSATSSLTTRWMAAPKLNLIILPRVARWTRGFSVVTR